MMLLLLAILLLLLVLLLVAKAVLVAEVARLGIVLTEWKVGLQTHRS